MTGAVSYLSVAHRYWPRFTEAVLGAGFTLRELQPSESGAKRYSLSGAVLYRHVGSDQLSDREMQVLTRIAAGDTTDRIARSLGLSASTIRTHTTRLFEKLGAKDRANAVHIAWRCGLLGGGETP